jgi:hypothetical protein
MTAVLMLTITMKAQLANTKWKGTFQFDRPTDVVLEFKKDTVTAFMADDNSMLETMTYTVNDTSFTIQRVWGQSNCNNDSKGQYHFSIKEGVMYVKIISDDCDGRSIYLNNSKWMKMP